MFSHPGFSCVVAEADGRIVGSNCRDERSVIAGIGPITVDPGIQNLGTGRMLMRAALDRASQRKAVGVRLVQAAYFNRSLSLYSRLQIAGFRGPNETPGDTSLDSPSLEAAIAVERGGRITGYATALAFSGLATTETNLDLQALIASAESFGGPGILVPSRNNAVLRWRLANGLHVIQPMTLMSLGLYNEPAGA
jgi:hypothetical protein